MKGMILCAGLGKRLAPITRSIPKPAVSVLNIPVVYINMLFLKLAGVDEVALNVHHLPQEMIRVIESRPEALKSLRIHISDERSELLGTGGGVKKMESLFAREDAFFVVNGDTFCDAPLSKGLLALKNEKATALMFVHPNQTGPYQPVYYSENDHALRVIPSLKKSSSLTGLMPAVFLGIQALTPKIFSYLPAGIPSDMIDYGYSRMLQSREPLLVSPSTCHWFDTGSVESLLRTHIELLKLLSNQGYADFLSQILPTLTSMEKVTDNIWIGPGTTISDQATLVPPVVIGCNVTIEGNAVVGPYTTLADGTLVPSESTLKKTVILSPREKIVAGSYENCVVFSGTRLAPTQGMT